MPTKLFRLMIDAVTTTTTEVTPDIEKYFYELREEERTDDTITIPATQFTDDAGDVMTGNLTPVTTTSGYYMLFINGVLQQSSLYTVSADGSQVVITEGTTIPVGSPISLVVTNFTSASDSNTIVTT